MTMSLENRRACVMGAILAAGAAAVVIAACSGTPRPRNLLLITLDTMRADRLPSYGFSGVDTPALDRIAAEGAVFEQAFASVPLTLPSHASLFTGLYPHRLNLRDNVATPLAPEFTTMAEALRDRGLMTGAFVASGVLGPSRGLDQGFVVYNDAVAAGCSSAPRARRPANEVVDEALKWIAEQPTAFFAWVHLYDTHRPYQLPSDYQGRYDNPYLEAIAFEDTQISRLIAHLEARRILDDTLIVVTGDHGESLGDHGEDSHGIFIYQEGLHVPLIVRGPGILPRRIGAVTRLVDLMPTVLELFGVAIPEIDGVSLTSFFSRADVDDNLEVYARVPVLTKIRLVRPPVPSRRSIQGHRSAASGVVRPPYRSLRGTERLRAEAPGWRCHARTPARDRRAARTDALASAGHRSRNRGTRRVAWLCRRRLPARAGRVLEQRGSKGSHRDLQPDDDAAGAECRALPAPAFGMPLNLRHLPFLNTA